MREKFMSLSLNELKENFPGDQAAEGGGRNRTTARGIKGGSL